MDVSSNEEAAFTRPTSDVILDAWKRLFEDPMLSDSKLKKQGLEGIPISTQGEVVPNWVPMRSVYWKFYLGLLPSHDPSNFVKPLSTSRTTYDTLRSQYLRAPDGRWASDVSVPAGVEARDVGEETGKSRGDLGVNNPLSLESENPWQSWFMDIELRKEIKKDVERTYPDIPYFTLPRVQKVLTTILFLYSTLHSNVGYRQGMHEICAAILLAVDLDSIKRNGADEAEYTLDREYIEHDTWSIYEAVMRSAVIWYQWKEETVSKGGEKPQQPIVQLCNHLHGTVLRSLDPQLWTKLEELGIEPQIYGIRWIRLMFTREFPLDDAMRVWDGLFAADSTLKMIEYICLAMLLRIRNEIIYADYSEALTTLLRYPTSNPPLLIPLLLQQATLLQNSAPSPALGVSIVMENQAILGIPANPPHPSQEEATSRSRGSSRAGGARPGQPPPPRGMAGSLALARNFDLSGAMGAAQQAAAGIGIQDLAKGLMERGQALGIDKSLLGKVAEIRKNLPDFPVSAYNRAHFMSPSYDDANQLPSRGPLRTPSPPESESSLLASSYPPPLNVLEDEIAQLKQRMRSMGDLMDTCLSRIDKHLRESELRSENSSESTTASTSIDSALSDLRNISTSLKELSSPFPPSPGTWLDPISSTDLGFAAGVSKSPPNGFQPSLPLDRSASVSSLDNSSTETRPISHPASSSGPASNPVIPSYPQLPRNDLPSLSLSKSYTSTNQSTQSFINPVSDRSVEKQVRSPQISAPILIESADREAPSVGSQQQSSPSSAATSLPYSWIRSSSHFTAPWSRATPSAKPLSTRRAEDSPQTSEVASDGIYRYPPVSSGTHGNSDPLDGALDVENGRKVSSVPRVGLKEYDPLGAL